MKDLGPDDGSCFGTRDSFELECLDRLYSELNLILGARAIDL